MLLILIFFFIPPLLGALANQTLASITDKTRSPAYAVLVLLVGIAYEVLAFSIPVRALGPELLMASTGVVVVVLIMIAIPLREATSPERTPPRDKRGENGGCAGAVVMLILPFASFTLVGRVHYAQKLAAEWNGTVAAKYHSHNHGVPSFQFTSGDEIEGVDRATWDAAVPGSRLAKPAWSAFGELNGERVRVVPETKVMFLGPFRD